MNTLDNHTIVVTGASRGIGEAAARLLARQGASVGLIARSGERIGMLAEELNNAGGTAVAITCDVGSDRSVEAAFDRIRSDLGRLTGLVNNAGVIAPIGRLGDTDPQAWANNVAVNLSGVYRVTRAALPDLLAADRGTVVNVSSGAASRAIEGWSAYCAAKAGAMLLTQSLDLEYGPEGLSVYGLRPGMVDTDMQGEIRESGINPVSQVARETLLPVSVPAAAIAWLLREAPADLRGRELDVRDEEVRRAAGLDRLGE